MKEFTEDNLLVRDVFLETFKISTRTPAAAGVKCALQAGVQLQDASDHFKARHSVFCRASSLSDRPCDLCPGTYEESSTPQHFAGKDASQSACG